MRGEVLRPDGVEGPGLIRGEDGKTYSFVTARVHRAVMLPAGRGVDFIGLGEEARDIYPLDGMAAAATPPVSLPVDAAYTPAIAARNDGFFTYFCRALSKNYFQFYGRARRAEYWGYILFFWLSLLAILTLDALVSAIIFNNNAEYESVYIPILTLIFCIYNIIPSTSITIRRLHDQDMSGWLYFLNLVPYIGGIVIFILMLFDSRPNPNKHGPSPKYGTAQTVQVFA
ncbi:MAG: DUF805 domain-containing protein [Hyphomonas sp.]